MPRQPTASPPLNVPPVSNKLFVPLGRGAHGKTLLTRWMVGRALNGGRPIVIGDADRTNPTLSAYFKKVERPPSADDRDVTEWLEQLVEQLVEKDQPKFSIILDFGGGDQVLKNLATEMGLVSLLESNGVEVVAFHLLGPDLDDLAYLRDMEAGAFAPKRTVLVLNEALVPRHLTAGSAFGALRKSEILLAAVQRDAIIVSMPELKCVAEIDRRRLTFEAAESGMISGKAVLDEKPSEPTHEDADPDNSIGSPPTSEDPVEKPMSITQRQRTTMWLLAMESAFKKVVHYLP